MNQALQKLVESIIDQEIKSNGFVTAWTVCVKLGPISPASDVRQVFDTIVSNGAYKMEWKNFNGQAARAYSYATPASVAPQLFTDVKPQTMEFTVNSSMTIKIVGKANISMKNNELVITV